MLVPVLQKYVDTRLEEASARIGDIELEARAVRQINYARVARQCMSRT